MYVPDTIKLAPKGSGIAGEGVETTVVCHYSSEGGAQRG